MKWKAALWSIVKAVAILCFKILVICFYIVSSLMEVLLKHINEYIKRRL